MAITKFLTYLTESLAKSTENEEPKHPLCVIMDCAIEMGGTSDPCAMTFLGRGWKFLRLLQCFFYHPSLLLIGKCMREVVDHGGWDDVLFKEIYLRC